MVEWKERNGVCLYRTGCNDAGAEVLQLLVGGPAIVVAIVEGELPQSGRLSQYMQ